MTYPVTYKSSKAYVDFLGLNAYDYANKYNHSYINDICVYAVSAANPSAFVEAIHNAKLTDYIVEALTGDAIATFALTDSASYMCYHFDVAEVDTESDSESDSPYSYEELFNTPITANLYKSEDTQKSYEWSAMNSMPTVTVHYTAGAAYTVPTSAFVSHYLATNKVDSTSSFSRTDYYKMNVPETYVVHDRSTVQLNDTSATIGNFKHDVFNALLYCINPAYSATTEGTLRGMPYGIANYIASSGFNAIPIAACTMTHDTILAGNNTIIEPNLNGLITLE